MTMDSTAYGIIIGVVATLIGAGIIYWIKNINIKLINQKIDDIKLEEKFLERISKGNIQLLRSSFITLFFILGIFGISLGTIVITQANNFSPAISKALMTFGGALALGGGLGAISYSRSIRKLKNLPEERVKLQKKRQQLEDKKNNA